MLKILIKLNDFLNYNILYNNILCHLKEELKENQKGKLKEN
jgi:hypothetical protein